MQTACSSTKRSFRSRECNSSEGKRPYSRVLYLVLFDTSLEKESVIMENNKIQNKQSSINWWCARCGNG
jgi:hypothetical protein